MTDVFLDDLFQFDKPINNVTEIDLNEFLNLSSQRASDFVMNEMFADYNEAFAELKQIITISHFASTLTSYVDDEKNKNLKTTMKNAFEKATSMAAAFGNINSETLEQIKNEIPEGYHPFIEEASGIANPAGSLIIS